MNKGFRFSSFSILNYLDPISPKACTHPGHSSIFAKSSLFWECAFLLPKSHQRALANQRNMRYGYHRELKKFCGPRMIKLHVRSLALCPSCLLADTQISNDTQELLFAAVIQRSDLQTDKSSLLRQAQTKTKPAALSLRLVKEWSPSCIFSSLLYWTALGSVSWVLRSLAILLF